jgi:hypothetical protein
MTLNLVTQHFFLITHTYNCYQLFCSMPYGFFFWVHIKIKFSVDNFTNQYCCQKKLFKANSLACHFVIYLYSV